MTGILRKNASAASSRDRVVGVLRRLVKRFSEVLESVFEHEVLAGQTSLVPRIAREFLSGAISTQRSKVISIEETRLMSNRETFESSNQVC